ncbi:MAG: DisA protein, partial [Spirochaetota bacterium]
MNNFLSFFSNIRWQDIVDISLNSYILFRFYILFQGTNAFRVLIGIAFLWFFQRLAFSLGLIITSWAIQGITAVAALIIIVVFRNEIRSVLQAKNFKTILWGF